MKKQKLFLVCAIIFVLFVITIPGWINDIFILKPDDSQMAENTANSENTETIEDSENIGSTELQPELETVFCSGVEKEWVSNEEAFRTWDSKALSLQKTNNLFEGFSMAEYRIEGKNYAVLSDEELILAFLDSGIEIMQKDTAEIFFVTDEDYSKNNFIFGKTYLKRSDVNHDGVEEVISSRVDGGTGYKKVKFTIIDIQNQAILPLKYHVNEFLFDIPKIEVLEETFLGQGERENIVIRYELEGVEQTHTIPMEGKNVDKVNFVMNTNYEVITCSEDGIISFETAVAVETIGGPSNLNVLRILCDFVYLPEEHMFKMDKDTLRFEPYEQVSNQ